MADSGSNREWREHLAWGRARTLIEALEAGETRGRGVQQQNISIGSAGVTLQNWVGVTGMKMKEPCAIGERR